MDSVIFKCIKSGSKMRVKIITPGYHNEANCQFPRAIRADGKFFKAPMSAVTLARGPSGTFFYRVSAKFIEEVTDGASVLIPSEKIKLRVFEDEHDDTCTICMEAPKELVIVPCGHFNMCKTCTESVMKTSKKCPFCRGVIQYTVTLDQIQKD